MLLHFISLFELRGLSLDEFRKEIKNRVLTAAGTTIWDYDEIRTTNPSGLDPIDEIIISSSVVLSDREIDVFGLAYRCHSAEQIIQRVRELKQYRKIGEKTVLRYLRDAKNDVFEAIKKNKETMQLIRRALREEYERKRNS